MVVFEDYYRVLRRSDGSYHLWYEIGEAGRAVSEVFVDKPVEDMEFLVERRSSSEDSFRDICRYLEACEKGERDFDPCDLAPSVLIGGSGFHVGRRHVIL